MNTILITGCSSGFGAAAVHHFAGLGWNVIATMRDPAGASGLPDAPNVFVTRLDVQDQASIGAAIHAGIARFGAIDVLVNNAGYGLMTVFEGTPREAVQRQFDVNVFGLMDVTRALLPHFRARRRGVIINVTSGAGVFGLPMASLYCASKFAVEGFSEALAYELEGCGIRVKLVEPGGAPGTGFMERSAAAGADVKTPAEYGPFIAATLRMYGGMVESSDRDAVDKVVAAIHAAAVDDSPRLRWLPTDDIRPFVEARRGTSEEAFQELVRGAFVPADVAYQGSTSSR